jgi:biotin transport system substrate-specific component
MRAQGNRLFRKGRPVIPYTFRKERNDMPALAPALARRQTAVPSVALDVFLVIAGVLLVAALAQFEIHLPLTPVPITGQTLGVLLVGASLGALRGGASMFFYWAGGAVGLPFYAGGEKGWEYATGATSGYLFGFVVAAVLLGWLAERGWDRSLGRSIGAMALAEFVIFGCGIAWLAHALDVPVVGDLNGANALSYGFYPFFVGDLLKVLIAAAVLPGVWRLSVAGARGATSDHSG